MDFLPVLATKYLPLLMMVANDHWASAPSPEVMAAQIEKETCITLTHRTCWSPRAELKTARENGIGLGQVTRAYNADGTIRFDKIAELRAQHKALAGWTWDQRYDPMLQITGLVLMDKTGHARYAKLTASPRDTWAFTLSGYNGGDGGVLKDRLLCKNTSGCDPTRWDNHVAVHSTKSRAKWKGYGQSAYEINRGYVARIFSRAPVYLPAWSRNAR